MRQTVSARLGQNLAFTPQLQQAIRLMQLSTLELKQAVMQTVESNPMLELEENDYIDDEDDQPPIEDDSDLFEDSAESRAANGEAVDDPGDMTDIPDELAVDVSWEDIYEPTASGAGPAQTEFADSGFEERNGAGTSLREDLLWQLNLAPLSDRMRLAAFVVVDSIDEDGMLLASIDDLLAALDAELGFDAAEMEAAVQAVQRFDPPGVGARDLSECLLLQLQRLPATTPWRAEASKLVRRYLPLLAGRDDSALLRRTRLSRADLDQVMGLIRSLNPRPGAAVGDAEVDYVEPDVIVRNVDGRWTVELNHELIPKVRVHQQYARYIKPNDTSADNVFLKDNLQDAKWFLKNLEYRNETLLKVAANIVERQRGFFEHGEEGMRPLVLADVAAAVDRHESTISRVTTRKYMATPRGVFELKYFFSSHVGTTAGGEVSSTAIRALIKKLTAEEDPRKPLSDIAIAALLKERGIRVARRTVAKYRDALAIPSSNQRKRVI